MKDKNKTTAIYVRVSTTKDSQKDSPEHQLSVNKEKANLEGLIVKDEYIYEDRDTGTTIVDRPAIQSLVEDAQKGLFNTVIFASMSRFARDTLDALTLKRILVDGLKIRLISLDEGYDSGVDSDELKFQIISAVNQKLSEQISLSSRRGIKESAKRGNITASKAPYGYKKVVIEDRKTLLVDEVTSENVKLIFSLYTKNNLGEKEICNLLNNKGIPSPKNGVWGVTSIQRILTNETYTGEYVFGKYTVERRYNDLKDLNNRSKVLVQKDIETWQKADNPKTHEAIIDKETYHLAQKIRLERGGGKRGGIRNKVNVFAGFIKCKNCGYSIVAVSSGKKTKDGKTFRYLQCSRNKRNGKLGCTNNFHLPYELFRDELITGISTQLKRYTTPEHLLEKFKTSIVLDSNNVDKEIPKINRQLELQRKLLQEIRKQKILGELDEAQFEFEKKEYEEEIRKLENRKSDLLLKKEQQNNYDTLYQEVLSGLNDLLDLDFENYQDTHITLKKLIDLITVDVSGSVTVITTFDNKISGM